MMAEMTEEATTENTPQEKLLVVDYSEKAFVVTGELTKTYKNDLSALGGKFNRHLRNGLVGWIFPKSKQEQVMHFLRSVDSSNQFSLPSAKETNELPKVAPVVNKTYQIVKFKIFKPKDGMTVRLTDLDKGDTMNGKVVRVESSNKNDIVDTAYVDFGGQTSMAVVCRGKWQIFGYFVNHALFFSE